MKTDYVAVEIRKYSDREEIRAELFVDSYEDGVCTGRSVVYGDGYARPDGKIFRDYFAGFWNDVKQISEHLYNQLDADEHEWLFMERVGVVGRERPQEIILPELPGTEFTIEFQELIPGIAPPRVPLLVAGFESLPLLPGWIVRDTDGNIVNEGMKLLTLKDIFG